MFLNYFPSSSHASLRHDDAEIVSQIFEDREDNLQRAAELVSELEDLYPEADILRTRKDVTDAMGAEWECNEDILVIVANLNIQSSPINWQFNKDVYGKQLTPPGCVSEGRLGLTDGRNLWGLSTTTGDQIWSVDLPNRANRTPILVGQTIVVETGEAHRGYDTEPGECLWVVGDLPTTTTTCHILRAQSCYFGDFEGTIWELKENGDWRSICSLDERIISVHVDESHVYALKRGPDQSGTTPETIHAIRKETGQIGWTHTPNGTLRSHLTSSAEHLFVSTRERLIALDVESGTVVWRNPVPSSKPDNEKVESEDSDRFSTDPDDDGSDNSLSTNIDWDTDFQYESESINRISLSSKPIFEEDLFAPTTRGLLRITSTSGEIEWKLFVILLPGFLRLPTTKITST